MGRGWACLAWGLCLGGCAGLALPGRLFAVGDLHGDLRNALRVLHLLNLTDPEGRWTGGAATVVQTGDVVDRGPFSCELLDLLARLKREAASAGGRVVTLLGNHELMAFQGDQRYANDEEVVRLGGPVARRRVFQADGPYGYVRRHPAAVVLGHSLFVHAGLISTYGAVPVPQLNTVVQEQIATENFQHPLLHPFSNGPMWDRTLISSARAGLCEPLEEALRNASLHHGQPLHRMVVGHTIQYSHRVGHFCGGRLVAFDISITAYNLLGADNIGAIEVVTEPRTGETQVVDHYAAQDGSSVRWVLERGGPYAWRIAARPPLGPGLPNASAGGPRSVPKPRLRRAPDGP
eukprot:EG_transcript_17370